MFKYKTEAELKAMTEAERDTYATEKRAHEEKLQKDAIDAAKSEFKTEVDAAKADAKKANERTEELALKVTELETKGGPAGEKGSIVKFFEGVITDKNLTKDSPKAPQNHAAETTVKAAALMTTANVVPNVTGGFSPLFGNYIDTEIGSTPKPDTVLMQLIDVKVQPGTENIYFVDRINEEGAAQFIAEGALKPLADAEYKTSSLQTKEAAVRWKFTNRLMFHAPAVVSDFRDHAEELVAQIIEGAIFDGDGLTVNMNGITSYAGAFVVPTGLAGAYADANIYDVINAMATQIRLANYKGQITAVLNPVWQARMAAIKDTDGRYIVPPFVSADGTKVMGVNVAYSSEVPATGILVGILKNYHLVISEDAIYAEGYENDDFSKNLVSKKIETFLNGYVKQSDEGSIIYDTIADVLTDIEIAAAE